MNRIENRTARLEHVKLRRAIEMEHDCRIDIRIRREDAPICGNASAINKELDEQIAQRIESGLESDNQWAWCTVSVCAVDDADPRLIGVDTLGCCSYESENHFIADGYFVDMMDAAVANLLTLRHASC